MAAFHRIVNERKQLDTPFSDRLRQLITVYDTTKNGHNNDHYQMVNLQFANCGKQQHTLWFLTVVIIVLGMYPSTISFFVDKLFLHGSTEWTLKGRDVRCQFTDHRHHWHWNAPKHCWCRCTDVYRYIMYIYISKRRCTDISSASVHFSVSDFSTSFSVFAPTPHIPTKYCYSIIIKWMPSIFIQSNK